METKLTREEQIVAALRRIIRAVDLHSKFLTHRYGLTGPQVLILQQLVRAPSLSTGELAERVHLSQGTVSDILDRLEKRQLIQRERSAEDRRRVLNRLTQRAEEILKDSPSLLQERFVGELQKLRDWEQTQILSTLQRVGEMMQAHAIEASPLLVSGPLTVSAKETAEFLAAEKEDTES